MDTRAIEKENKIYASVSTLLMFLMLLFILFFIKFITPLPPFPETGGGEIGLATNFGTVDEGKGENFTYDEVSDQKDAVPNSNSDPNDNMITDDSKDNNDFVKTDKNEQPKKDIDKKDKVKDQQPDKNAENAFKNFSDKPNGDGDKDKTGNQGKPEGGDSKNYDGNNKTGEGGDGGPNTGPGKNGPVISLKGRRIHYPPDKITDFTEEGVIVVDIIVNKNGKVISAEANRAKSINPNYVLCAKAQLAAKSTVFNESPDGALEQKGTITFKFTLK